MSTPTTRLGLLKAVDADDRADYLTVDLAASLDVLDAAVGGAALNQLVNGGFEVHQRGGTVTANNAYAHDRWQLLLGGTSTATITDDATIVSPGSGHAMKVAYVHGSAVSQVDQKIEHYLQLRGMQVTFALDALQPVSSSGRPYISDSGVKTYGPTAAGAGTYARRSVTATIGAASTSVRVGWEFAATDTVYLDNAVLVVGASPAAYAPEPPGVALLRCQRYYQEIGGLDNNEFVAIGQNTSTTAGLVVLRFPVEMAVAPTGSVSAASDWQVFDAAGAAVACTALTFGIVTRRSCRIAYTVASGLVAGNAAMMRANSTANARIKLEANP